VTVLLEKIEPLPAMVRFALDIDIAPPLKVAVLLEKFEPLPEMVRLDLYIDIAPPSVAEFRVKSRFEPVRDTVEPKAA
jgi:hypothetical protein